MDRAPLRAAVTATLLTAALVVAASAQAQGRGLYGDPELQRVGPGEAATVRIRLDLPGVLLTVAEFDLIIEADASGGETCPRGFVSVVITPGGPTWTGTRLFNPRGNGRYSISLLMDPSDGNAAHDLMAEVVLRDATGPVRIFVRNPVASADLDVPPFFQLVDIGPRDSDLLATVEFPPPGPDDDGVPDDVDVCPGIDDPLQQDTDGDGIGDFCNGCFDRDGDEWADALDVCPDVFDPGQEDSDGDGIGDVCDGDDRDEDGVIDDGDVCPDVFDPGQGDRDEDGIGDACNDAIDRDGDDWADTLDLCPEDFDPNQGDRDGDGVGDACNSDIDRDRDDWADAIDLCPDDFDPDQTDLDGDGLGDVCDPTPDGSLDADGDGVINELDVCRDVPDPGQEDREGDGIGDACDDFPDDIDLGALPVPEPGDLVIGPTERGILRVRPDGSNERVGFGSGTALDVDPRGGVWIVDDDRLLRVDEAPGSIAAEPRPREFARSDSLRGARRMHLREDLRRSVVTVADRRSIAELRLASSFGFFFRRSARVDEGWFWPEALIPADIVMMPDESAWLLIAPAPGGVPPVLAGRTGIARSTMPFEDPELVLAIADPDFAPVGMDVDSSGRLWVADAGRAVLLEVDPSAGSVVESFSDPIVAEARDLAVAADDAPVIVTADALWRFERGAARWVEIVPDPPLRPLPGGLEHVVGVRAPEPLPDRDGDGVADGVDRCPDTPDPDQTDSDLDRIGDACDPLPDSPETLAERCEADLLRCRIDRCEEVSP